MSRQPSEYRHVRHLWDDAKAGAMDPLARLVYRSNILGSDQRITNTGGGNTSSKIHERDPLTGESVDVLWVKGSGGDLRTANKGLFASLYMTKLEGLQRVWGNAAARGPKTPIEDEMVGAYSHCTFNLNPRASSIDTPLHAFVPRRHVDHMHPNAVISIAACARGAELTREVFGDEVIWTPWQRPGFDLGLVLKSICEKHPKAKGVILGQHGLINWADDDKACYELTLDLIEKAARFIEARDKGDKTFGGMRCTPMAAEKRDELLAEVLPWLRGKISAERRFIGTVQTDDTILRFVCSNDAPRLAMLGTSCPDHFLRTKIRPMLADWLPGQSIDQLKAALEAGLAQYRKDYASYYERCKRPDSPAMRDPNPTVILIPGVGMIAWGKNKSESRVTAEFYNCAVEVMRGSEAIDRYIALPEQEAFDIEYWLLEEAKLKRMPPEPEMGRKVALVVGAGNGIGKSVAHRVAKDGAHVVCADLSLVDAESTAAELVKLHGEGIGVAGSGVSSCGPALASQVDITNRASVRAMLRRALMAYGGIDMLIVTAGIYVAPDAAGSITDEAWKKTFDVNVMGSYLIADEATALLRSQGLRASMVLTTSVNGMVSKRGSFAYDTSKAAANHLSRELSIELAPLVRVNAVAPATVVAGSTMFPRDRVIASLIKYKIAFDEKADTETLRSKLADFYAQRTLTKTPITPADQAEAIWFLASDRSSKTTGQVFCVDGGLIEAFMR
ncbi:MAG: bifunctional rhamnulose-1-phosphate aldolase/short-chain dehydrogenase [Phycisphaerales bacterium]|nr:bifunctional rhamnulose-1-phosphate aldolase/short-chain dehydrogenase [Phycisphaerales bacterium]